MKLPKKHLTQSDWLLVVANLLPVYGVWFLGWKAAEVFTVYSLETIIIGIITVVKLIISSSVRQDSGFTKAPATWAGPVFIILFFILHYGIFVFVQMSIFFSVSGIALGDFSLLSLLFHPTNYLSFDGWIMLSVFMLGYAYKSLLEFILSGRYKTTPVMAVMFEPYGRIFIQQFTIIIGSMFLVFGAGKIFIAIFTIIKIYFSVYIDYAGIMGKKLQQAAAQERSNSHS